LNLMKVDIDPTQVAKLHSVTHFTGLPMDARTVTNAISSHEGAQR